MRLDVSTVALCCILYGLVSHAVALSCTKVQYAPPATRTVDRRNAIQQSLAPFLLASTSAVVLQPQGAAAEELSVVKTPSGLKYLDLIVGTGDSPAYGSMVTVTYKGYVKLPANSKGYPTEPQMFEQVKDGFLFKHGSGRMIPGFDEGLHTMREGGTRRILIPPKLGFVGLGLGPLPASPFSRNKLIKLLDQTVELSGGTLIYEVTLNGVYQDEVDQGYYSDSSLTPEEFDTLRRNIQSKGNAARLEAEAAARQPKNADKVI